MYKCTPLRETRITKILLELFSKNKKPLSALEIIEHTAKTVKTVNKTTIYRALETLEKKGIINILMFKDGARRYESANLPHHHHIICEKCSRTEDISLDSGTSEIERRVAKTKNFTITGHSIEFYGICKKCLVGAKNPR